MVILMLVMGLAVLTAEPSSWSVVHPDLPWRWVFRHSLWG